ncbi:MAG: hypothetical protein JRC99_10625 [Deltaproteobacteria bacterium]|nr:hypothetical protein [Deltaproteobacteria bacterium]
MGEDFLPDAEFPIDPKWGDMIADVVPNVFNVLIVSKRVRDILQSEDVSDVEYLPFVILDKKGRIKSKDYCVANLIGSVDCLDAANSVFKDDPLEKGQIIDIECLNIIKEKVPEDKKLFRLEQRRHLFIIRNDLLQRLQGDEITGLETYEMGSRVFIP